ncbi:NADh:flavin oxidoreductase NADh oxidase family protein [Rutstroemia sp. NJR-2017a BVV2]|nr:NADh:flavin oxidoreductase NADh oxidase family protein [Rutstroemia sp. NJR-2017a BVV2]
MLNDIPYEGGATPTPLTEEEIKEYVGLYAQAAKNSIAASFDGVEVHGANGYLIDQFIQDISNNRTDAWGGSVEKRARFGIEAAKAVVEAVGADRTGFRMSPYSEFQGMRMKDPKPQFAYLAQELKKLKLHRFGSTDVEATENVDFLVDIWDNQSPVLIAGGFTQDSAKRAADEEYKGKDVAIVFGRYFISNPDLVFRVEKGIEFTPYDRKTFYSKGEEGYTTWPFSKEFEAQALKL